MTGTTVIVGLLGGIASGKSTVARLLAGHGARVVDADRIAREVLANPEVRPEVVSIFGAGAYREDGTPDRGRIAAMAFTDEGKLSALEAAVHPRVRTRIRREIEAAGDVPVLVLDAPLLLEGGLAGIADVLVCVDAPEATRKARAERDRGWDAAELERREERQAAPAEKRRAAAIVIENDGSLEDLEAKVAALWDEIVRGAANGEEVRRR